MRDTMSFPPCSRRLRKNFSRVCADFGASLISAHGEGDHVCLLVEYPPKIAVSGLVNSLKGVSSRMLRQERPDIGKYCQGESLWSPSYLAVSGDVSLEDVRRYVGQ